MGRFFGPVAREIPEIRLDQQVFASIKLFFPHFGQTTLSLFSPNNALISSSLIFVRENTRLFEQDGRRTRYGILGIPRAGSLNPPHVPRPPRLSDA